MRKFAALAAIACILLSVKCELHPLYTDIDKLNIFLHLEGRLISSAKQFIDTHQDKFPSLRE